MTAIITPTRRRWAITVTLARWWLRWQIAEVERYAGCLLAGGVATHDEVRLLRRKAQELRCRLAQWER